MKNVSKKLLKKQEQIMKHRYEFISIIGTLLFTILLTCFLYGQQVQNILVLDDFENFPKNKLNGETGGFYEKATVMVETETGTNAFDGKGKSVSIKYDVSTENSFCGHYSKFSSLNLSEYNYLSLWIKGENSKEYLQIQLATKEDTAKVPLWNYLSGGPTKNWQKVVIPLDAFWNLRTRTGILELVIVFENYQSNVNESPLNSKVYIDDIICGTFFPGYVKIDHFEDKVKSNALGGNIGEFSQSDTEGLYTSEINCNVFNLNPCGLEVHYDNSQDSEFGGVFFILGGGSDGWIKRYKNVSSYQKLHIAAKAESQETNPGNFKVELKPSPDTAYWTRIEGISTYWKEWDKYFNSDFQPNFSSADIGEFTIVFERNQQDKLKGIVYIDEIELRSSWYKGPDYSMPPKPSDLEINGTPIQDYIEVKGNFTVKTSFYADIQRLESVRLEYRLHETQGSWIAVKDINRKYADNNNTFSWSLKASDFPSKIKLDIRAVAQNYNGLESISNNSIIVDVKKENVHYVKEFALYPNYPNPFNPSTTIRFYLNKRSEVVVHILNLNGKTVKQLLNSTIGAGEYKIDWDGTDENNCAVASGIYLLNFKADKFVISKKIMLLK
ncbi:MAG: T9SS type A sorting domain-containing protein [Candidatus Hodarchaeota archaeon]